MFPIIEKTDLSATVSKFVIGAPYIARKRQPGNFIMLRLDETGERIPLTIVDGDAALGTITLIVQAIGKTTKALCRKRKGDVITDVVGPLGNPTPLEYH